MGARQREVPNGRKRKAGRQIRLLSTPQRSLVMRLAMQSSGTSLGRSIPAGKKGCGLDSPSDARATGKKTLRRITGKKYTAAGACVRLSSS